MTGFSEEAIALACETARKHPRIERLAAQGAGVFYVLPDIVREAARVLWREWRRGRMAVELPEPDTSAYPKYEAPSSADQYWKIEPDEDECGPLVLVQYPPHRLPLDEARAFFTAGLAACANAERLVAEFLARPKPDSPVRVAGVQRTGETSREES